MGNKQTQTQAEQEPGAGMACWSILPVWSDWLDPCRILESIDGLIASSWPPLLRPPRTQLRKPDRQQQHIEASPFNTEMKEKVWFLLEVSSTKSTTRWRWVNLFLMWIFCVQCDMTWAAYTVCSSPAVCLSSYVPLLVKSYFLATADLFGHSGACMIDVFLAVKRRCSPNPPSYSLELSVCQIVEWRGRSLRSRCEANKDVGSEFIELLMLLHGRPPALILIVMVLKNAYPACLAPGVILCQQKHTAQGRGGGEDVSAFASQQR